LFTITIPTRENSKILKKVSSPLFPLQCMRFSNRNLVPRGSGDGSLADCTISLLRGVVDAVAIDASCRGSQRSARSELLLAMVVHVFEIESVHVAGKVAEEGQEDVDEKVASAAADQEDADGRDEERDEDDKERACVCHGC